MASQNDPFAVFDDQKEGIQEMGKTKKKVHIDPDMFDIEVKNNQSLVNDDSDRQATNKKLEDIEIQFERTEQGCLHEVFYPKNFKRKVHEGPCNARKYPFKLDPFQQKSVYAIECDESVLVCAHTSAGKTAVAQYAIATCIRNRSRVIYTSPIKALSNQKYRQLKKDFDDVGLVTGDVTIDQGASCLVMTTQILRNMIYRGNQIVREVKWVVFDEVHYMRDKERGVVWQETIIMMPPEVKYVFLSATIGNPQQFARWITKLRRQPCNVLYTDYRPVPLEHYLCPAGGQGLYMVVDDNGKFHENQFNKAIESLGESVNVIGMNPKKKKNQSQGADLSKIIKVIMEKRLDPAIVFSFSKKDVEGNARSIVTKYDLTTKQQKQTIREVYADAIAMLDKEDQELVPITYMKGIIEKGIGIHHGGLLPLVKETVEVLFQAGLIKILFSTQTFSMGVNMPAKTVVFTSVRKFDGEIFRWIGGGQYIQMSGRAGRRGLDKKGITILMIDEKMEPEAAKSMLKGSSDNLKSSFYISYNMLLNSQRLQDIDPDFILARTLLQHQQEANLPKLMEQYNDKLEKYKGTEMERQQELESLYLLTERIQSNHTIIKKLTYTPQNIMKCLNIGRVIQIRSNDGKIDWGLGCVINFKKEKSAKKQKEDSQNISYIVDVMIYIQKKQEGDQPQPCSIEDQNGEMSVIPFTFDCIWSIKKIYIKELPNDLTVDKNKAFVHQTLRELSKRKLTNIELQTTKTEVKEIRRKIAELEKEADEFKDLVPKIQIYKQRRKLYEEIKNEGQKIKENSNIVLKKEKKAYTRVMKRMGLVQKGVVTRKGNVTCEISTNHELLLTELLFAGFFNDLTSSEIAAILTSLLHDEKASSDRKFTKSLKLKQKLQEMIQQAKKIYQVLNDCKVSIEEDEYIDSIKEQLVEVTYEWCQGATFAQIQKQVESYQGTIVRTLRRLHELLKQMSNAAKIIGNQELSEKFDDAGTKVFRGMIQAASLYTV